MAVLRWDPWGELAALQRDVNELFTRTTPRAAAGTAERATNVVPPIDAFSTDEGLVVRVELPGMGPDDVDVSVNDGMLTISGERKAETEIPSDRWLRRERTFGAFERSFTLPEGTDPNQIKASFEHGLLELQIPHPPERKPHKVSIDTGSQDSSSVVDVSDQS